MKCPECRTQNPEFRKFCRECGNKLLLICPDCNYGNIPGDKFCGECGYNLLQPKDTPKALTFDDKLDKIQRYLPEGITEKILSQRGKIEGERKQVTVMFCDLEGFTPLVEQLGAEEAYHIMDQVYELLIHKVHDYEGTVNEMTGDGIMALFGAPIAVENAPQRAIRSAYAIHREMSRFNDKLKENRKSFPPFKMRIGIHSGPVVVGTLGNNLRVEFKAVGDTVNIASRMEGLAEPGTIYVSNDTFKLAEGFFQFEALGEKYIKGKEVPISVYRVIAPSSRITRFDVSAETGLSPLIGREREREILLDAFERSKEGRGQVFSIVSEAGLGKSRLLYEFGKSVSNENVTFLEAKCLSYSKGVAYHPIIDLLKTNFKINAKDEGPQVKRKVQSGLKGLNISSFDSVSYIMDLLSVQDTAISKSAISPEAKRDQIISTLIEIIIKRSEIKPQIIAIEDLHWIDQSTEDCLKYLVESISGARVLLIFTYRPEFVPSWKPKSYQRQINLNLLSNQECLMMVHNLLDTEFIDNDLKSLILEKTEGIPFFIEELVKSLIEIKVIKKIDNRYHLINKDQGISIPSTIQEIIMARVDSQPESAKILLQVGSVIEREFPSDLIMQVAELDKNRFLDTINILKDSELLYERGIFPNSVYVFKHALTQEVIYRSILSKNKKALHVKIGCAMEKIYEKNLNEYCGLLARHFIEGQNYDKGAQYSEMAAKVANMAASSTEAFRHSLNRIFCLEHLPPSDLTKKQIIDARAALAAYYINYAHIAEAYKIVAPIADLTEQINYIKRLPIIYTTLGVYAIAHEENFPKSLKYLNDSLKISEEIQNPISSFLTLWNLGLHYSWDCQFEKGEGYLKTCFEMSNSVNNLLGMSASKSTLCNWSYLNQGRIDLASSAIEDSLKIAEKSGDIYAKGLAYTGSGYLSYIRGSMTKSEDHLLKGFGFLGKTNQIIFSSWAALCLGQYYLETKHYDKALGYFDKSQSILIESNNLMPSFINRLAILVAKTEAFNGETDICLPDLILKYNQNAIKVFDGWMARDIAETMLCINAEDLSEIEVWIKKAIENDMKNGMKWQMASDYALYSEFYNCKSDNKNTRKYLLRAIESFQECGADGWVEKYEEKLR